MKTHEKIEGVMIPEWAVCAIEYGDISGMSEEDAILVSDWLDSIERPIGSDLVFDYESEPQFVWKPEFGLATNCYETTITILIP